MQLLVSVANAEEATAAVDGGADIVDAKDPAVGALGAVAPDVFIAIAAAVNDARPLSAALGEPVDEQSAAQLAATFGAAGAAFVKLGFRKDVSIATMARLLTAARDNSRAKVIAVAYADVGEASGCLRVVEAAASAGVAGVLLDTADKAGRSLCEVCFPVHLKTWITRASASGLLIALAGRLRLEDVGAVCGIGASIVGVRGAACDGGREGRVSRARVQALKAACTAARRG